MHPENFPGLSFAQPARPGKLVCGAAAAVFLAALLSGCQSMRFWRKDRAKPPVPKVAAAAPAAAPATLAPVESTARLTPALLQAPTRRFTLGPGDVLEIEVLGEAETRAQTAIGPDGKIYYYLLSGLRVEGLTLGETKAKLEQELGNFIRGAQVALTLRRVESKHVWLLGRLGTPGIYAMNSPTTLLEAISLAGGPALAPESSGRTGSVARSGGVAIEPADLRHSFVLRGGQMLPVDFERLLRDGDPGQNIFLEADDFVYLPAGASSEVYVLGSVVLPQPVENGGGISLVGAIAGAGGPLREASLSNVAIVRGSLTSPHVAIVDYQAILKGKAPDVRLEARDIVYVPKNGFATITRYTDLILNTFARTIGANEGARAVSRDSSILGATVPLVP